MATTIRKLETRIHDVVARVRELTAERDRLHGELRAESERMPGPGGQGHDGIDDGERAHLVAEIRGALEELRAVADRAGSRGPTP
jgi:hypothetical protein